MTRLLSNTHRYSRLPLSCLSVLPSAWTTFTVAVAMLMILPRKLFILLFSLMTCAQSSASVFPECAGHRRSKPINVTFFKVHSERGLVSSQKNSILHLSPSQEI